MKKCFSLICYLLFLTLSVSAQYIGGGFGSHSIVVKPNGKVYTWGRNNCGQLGNGNYSVSNVPVEVSASGVLNGKTITHVARGVYHCIALASDGTAYTWGRNIYGELGDGNSDTDTASNIPVAVGGALSGKAITQVACGSHHCFVLTSDNKLYTWGGNHWGQLGNGDTSVVIDVPAAVNTSGVLSGKTITKIACGSYNCIVLTSDDSVYTWGRNHFGQLGNGSTGTNSYLPVAIYTGGVLNGKTITQVAGGGYHLMVLTSDGKVYTWGYNGEGELGNGNTGTNSNVPVAIYTGGALSGKTITQIVGGSYHSLALTSDNTLYSWGRNNYGQLGNGNTGTNSDIPVEVSSSGELNGKTITQFAGGYFHSIALTSLGTVYTWGYNGLGQLGNGNYTDSNVPVAVDQSGMGVLPVELSKFSAVSVSNRVLLTWQTATEVNNFGFEIERALTTLNYQNTNIEPIESPVFEKIGFVQGNNNSNASKSYTFIDENPGSGNIKYRLKQIDNDGKFCYSDFVEIFVGNPQATELHQNYPNPFNPTTAIKFSLNKETKVKINVYDILGNKIIELMNEYKPAGSHIIYWNGDDSKGNKVAGGVYFYKLETGTGSGYAMKMKKMNLLK